MIADAGSAGDITASASRANKRIVRRDASVARDAQNLASQDVPVTRRVVTTTAARAGSVVVGSAVAYADVEIAILAKVHVTRVVIATARRHAIHQHDFAGGIDDVCARPRAQHEA